MPPVLGPATSAEVSDGWSCNLGVTSPEVWSALLPEGIVGSLVTCADGRDHQLCRLTLLAARCIRETCTLGGITCAIEVLIGGVGEVLWSAELSGSRCMPVTCLQNEAIARWQYFPGVVNGKRTGRTWATSKERKRSVIGSYRDALSNCRYTIVNLKVHWRGPQVFFNMLESWVHFLQLITQGKSIRMCGSMGSVNPSVKVKIRGTGTHA